LPSVASVQPAQQGLKASDDLLTFFGRGQQSSASGLGARETARIAFSDAAMADILEQSELAGI
jgi:hypothetical protein